MTPTLSLLRSNGCKIRLSAGGDVQIRWSERLTLEIDETDRDLLRSELLEEKAEAEFWTSHHQMLPRLGQLVSTSTGITGTLTAIGRAGAEIRMATATLLRPIDELLPMEAA